MRCILLATQDNALKAAARATGRLIVNDAADSHARPRHGAPPSVARLHRRRFAAAADVAEKSPENQTAARIGMNPRSEHLTFGPETEGQTPVFTGVLARAREDSNL
jgi:hypothetical protein